MNRKSSCYLLLLLACVIAIYSCDKVFEKESNPVDSRFDVYAAKSYLHDSLKVNSEHLVLGSPAALKK